MRALITREGEYWTVSGGGAPVRVRDTKGMHYLAALVEQPGVDRHALDLVTAVEGAAAPAGPSGGTEQESSTGPGDAGELLDPEAKEAYRSRYEELQEELAEGESWGDPERVAAAKRELDFIAGELAAAVGLGGRDRRAASATERARVNVTRAIRSALKRISEHDADLGRSLELTIKTGTFCSYRSAPGFEVALAPAGGEVAAPEAPAGREAPTAEEPPPAAPTAPGLVGRETEVAQLEAGLAEARAGRGSLFLIAGEPGVGKTRLADALAEHSRAEGSLVLWGRCWEGGGAPAFWPWVQVVREYLAETDAEQVAERLGPASGLLAQLVPELGLRPAPQAAPTLDSEQARFAFFDAIASLLRQAGRDRALVVVLDDLHAADESSLLLLDFLARELGTTGVLALGSYRPAEGSEQTHALIGRVTPHARVLQLAGLGQEAVGGFVEERTGAPAPAPLVGALHSATDGNPFFMEEVLRLLLAQGLLERPEDLPAKLPVPAGVRDAVRRRLEPLSDESTRLLQLGAVLGKEFTLRALERASELAPGQVLELLDEAVLRGLVSADTEVLGRFRFVHALIREVLYDGLSATARIDLHQRVGDGLEQAYADDPEPYLAELAHHFLQAAPAGDVDKAVAYAERAGARAMNLLAFEEAARSVERALQALDLGAAPDRSLRCDLLLALGTARSAAGDPEGAKEAFRRAGELARRLRDLEREGRAALGYAGRYWTTGVVDASAVDLLERAIGALGDDEGLLKAELLGALATQLYYSESLERSDSLSAEAVRIARDVGAPGPLASVLAARLAAAWRPDNLEERAGLASEVVELARRTSDRETELRGRAFRVTCLLEQGDAAAAEAEIDVASQLAEELRQPLLLWHTRGLRALVTVMSGRFAEAERHAGKALAAGRRADEQNALHYYGIQLATLRYDQGRLEEIEPPMRAFVDQYKNLPAWRFTISLLYGELDRPGDARREFEIAGAGEWEDIPRDSTWLLGIARAAESCAALEDSARAPRLYELLLPYAGRAVVLGRVASICIGAAERQLGQLAALLDRHEDADRHFEGAVELNARMGALPWLARAQLDWARQLIAGGENERAIPLLDAAAATAAELGMSLVAERVAAARAGA